MKHNRAKRRDGGFTVVEVLIILFSIIFLVAIVAYTYDGIKARSRNDIRTADLRRLQVYIETFYSQNTYYPSRADINNPSWATVNLKGFKNSFLEDPSWTTKNTYCSLKDHPILTKRSSLGCFGYAPTNNGVSCERNAATCNKYTLTTTMENGGGYYSLKQLD